MKAPAPFVSILSRFGFGPLALGFLALGILLAPSSAYARVTHLPLETFGSANQPTFIKAEGLAIDPNSGDLLVIDAGAGTVSRYQPDGTPADFSALGSNVIAGLSFGGPAEVQVAVDNSGTATDGNIYVTQSGAHLIEIFGEDGNHLGQLTASSEGAFGESCGVTVDPEGNVYVGQYGEAPGGIVHKFEPSGSFPVNGDNTLNFGAATRSCTLAAGAGPSAGSVFFAGYAGRPITKFDSSSGAEKYLITPGTNTTVSVDPGTGHLFGATGSAVNEYDASGAVEATLLSSFSPPKEVWGVAVNAASGNVYVAEENNPHIEVWGPPTILPDATTEEATEVEADSATLNGTVSAAGGAEASCEFQYTTEAAFEKEGFQGSTSVPCPAPNSFEGSASEAVSVHVSGLSIAGDYRFRVVASNENGSSFGAALGFQTLGPAVADERASAVTLTSATISGLIDPRGEATSFVVEYVTEAQFLEDEYLNAISVPVPAEEVGSGSGFLAVIYQLTGLAPGTTYHFRLAATNPAATNQGVDGHFITFSPANGVLPDGRAYEMVSPPLKLGQIFPPEPVGNLSGSCEELCLPIGSPMPMQSAPNGEAIVYQGQPFSAGLASGPNEYLSGRSASGWGAPENLSSPISNGGYVAFSADLSRSVVYQINPALSPDAPTQGGESYANLYLREEDGALQPVVTEAPPHRAPGRPGGPGEAFRIVFAGANQGGGASAAFGHLVFEANDALTEEVPTIAPEAPEVEAGSEGSDGCGGGNCNLYEWFEGQLRLVNVLPGNDAAAFGAAIGSGLQLIPIPTYEAPDVDHAISADGSRIFWSDESGQVYVRIDGKETREIADHAGKFLTASADGAKVLLSDGCLYRLQTEACEDLTKNQAGVSQGGFQGILGGAEDLSRVYFVDEGVLTGENAEEKSPSGAVGARNLYFYEADDPANPGHPRTVFIGALRQHDNEFGAIGRYGDWKAGRPNRTAQVSSDGRYLAFMSQAPLTGYDNTISGGGECKLNEGAACFEVFEYASDDTSLSCVSCNPAGQRPIGQSNLSVSLGNGIPSFPPLPQMGNLSAEGGGRLFFESQDTLSPADTNGNIQDVYEWEPNGVGSCERADGCISLISSGHAANDSMFLTSTPSGNDVFFITRERLLGRDKDDLLDVYDARAPHVPGEAVGFSEGTTPPCLGAACRGPIPLAPAQQGAGSSTFSGHGNEKPKCNKKQKKCGKPKKHRKHKRHHKRSAKHNHGGSK